MNSRTTPGTSLSLGGWTRSSQTSLNLLRLSSVRKDPASILETRGVAQSGREKHWLFTDNSWIHHKCQTAREMVHWRDPLGYNWSWLWSRSVRHCLPLCNKTSESLSLFSYSCKSCSSSVGSRLTSLFSDKQQKNHNHVMLVYISWSAKL